MEWQIGESGSLVKRLCGRREGTALLEMVPVGYLPRHCQEEAAIAKALLLEVTLLRRLFLSPKMLGVLCPMVSGLTHWS